MLRLRRTGRSAHGRLVPEIIMPVHSGESVFSWPIGIFRGARLRSSAGSRWRNQVRTGAMSLTRVVEGLRRTQAS